MKRTKFIAVKRTRRLNKRRKEEKPKLSKLRETKTIKKKDQEKEECGENIIRKFEKIKENLDEFCQKKKQDKLVDKSTQNHSSGKIAINQGPNVGKTQ